MVLEFIVFMLKMWVQKLLVNGGGFITGVDGVTGEDLGLSWGSIILKDGRLNKKFLFGNVNYIIKNV